MRGGAAKIIRDLQDRLRAAENENAQLKHNLQGASGDGNSLVATFESERRVSLEKLSATEAELQKAQAIIAEVHEWAVCAAITTPEDMYQNFPRIVELTSEDA